MMCPTWTVIAAILSLRAGDAPRHVARSAPPAPCLRVAVGIPPGPARAGTLQARGPYCMFASKQTQAPRNRYESTATTLGWRSRYRRQRDANRGELISLPPKELFCSQRSTYYVQMTW